MAFIAKMISHLLCRPRPAARSLTPGRSTSVTGHRRRSTRSHPCGLGRPVVQRAPTCRCQQPARQASRARPQTTARFRFLMWSQCDPSRSTTTSRGPIRPHHVHTRSDTPSGGSSRDQWWAPPKSWWRTTPDQPPGFQPILTESFHSGSSKSRTSGPPASTDRRLVMK